MTLALATVALTGLAYHPLQDLLSGDVTTVYQALNTTGITGLYDGSGSLLTNSCNVGAISYELTYSTPDGVAQYYKMLTANVFRARVTVNFSSSAWTSYKSGSVGVVGVKVCNYTGLGNSPVDQFVDPASWPSPLSPSTSAYLSLTMTGIYASDETFSGVRPIKIPFSQLIGTGTSGYIEWDDPDGSGGFEPWDHHLTNGRTGTWFGAVWNFPKWGANGAYTLRSVNNYNVYSP